MALLAWVFTYGGLVLFIVVNSFMLGLQFKEHGVSISPGDRFNFSFGNMFSVSCLKSTQNSPIFASRFAPTARILVVIFQTDKYRRFARCQHWVGKTGCEHTFSSNVTRIVGRDPILLQANSDDFFTVGLTMNWYSKGKSDVDELLGTKRLTKSILFHFCLIA